MSASSRVRHAARPADEQCGAVVRDGASELLLERCVEPLAPRIKSDEDGVLVWCKAADTKLRDRPPRIVTHDDVVIPALER